MLHFTQVGDDRKLPTAAVLGEAHFKIQAVVMASSSSGLGTRGQGAHKQTSWRICSAFTVHLTGIV